MSPRLGILIMLATGPAAAAPMDGAAFEAHVAGRTFEYSLGGVVFGAETYLPDRRVVWSFLDGRCYGGRWYPQDGAICFEHEGRDEAQCWAFAPDGEGMSAQFVSAPDGDKRYAITPRAAPLDCADGVPGV